MLRLGRGDPDACRLLVERHLGRVVAFAARVLGTPSDAEDVAQEVFTRLWRQARSWRPAAGGVRAWLYRVALHRCLDRLARRRERPLDDVPDPPDPEPTPAARLEEAEVMRIVGRAVAALPPRQRAAHAARAPAGARAGAARRHMKGDESMGLDRLAELLDAYGARSERWPSDERAGALALLAGSAQARALRDCAARLDALLDRLPVAVPSPGLAARVVRAARPPRAPWPAVWGAAALAAAAGLALWLAVPRAPRGVLDAAALARLGELRTPTDALLAASDLDGDDIVPAFGCEAPDVDCGDAPGAPRDPQEVHA